MPTASSFMLFLAATVALLVVPGPAVMYIVARSIDQGRSAGIVSALGIAVGTVILVAAAAFGVSALLAASPLAYKVVRYAGAAYLLYLGIRTALAKPVAVAAAHAVREPLRRIFAEGIVVNLLNPKAALFVFAFIPQFVNPAGNVRLQIVALGLIFTVLAMVSDSIYAIVAGTIAGRIQGNARLPRIRRVAVATTYIALSILALLVHPTK